MNVTSVKINLAEKDHLRGYATITLDDAFVVSGITVMEGKNGLFVSMPHRKGVDQDGNDKFFDTSYPLSKELRDHINESVLGSYQSSLEQNNAQDLPFNEESSISKDKEKPSSTKGKEKDAKEAAEEPKNKNDRFKGGRKKPSKEKDQGIEQ